VFALFFASGLLEVKVLASIAVTDIKIKHASSVATAAKMASNAAPKSDSMSSALGSVVIAAPTPVRMLTAQK